MPTVENANIAITGGGNNHEVFLSLMTMGRKERIALTLEIDHPTIRARGFTKVSVEFIVDGMIPEDGSSDSWYLLGYLTGFVPDWVYHFIGRQHHALYNTRTRNGHLETRELTII